MFLDAKEGQRFLTLNLEENIFSENSFSSANPRQTSSASRVIVVTVNWTQQIIGSFAFELKIRWLISTVFNEVSELCAQQKKNTSRGFLWCSTRLNSLINYKSNERRFVSCRTDPHTAPIFIALLWNCKIVFNRCLCAFRMIYSSRFDYRFGSTKQMAFETIFQTNIIKIMNLRLLRHHRACDLSACTSCIMCSRGDEMKISAIPLTYFSSLIVH